MKKQLITGLLALSLTLAGCTPQTTTPSPTKTSETITTGLTETTDAPETSQAPESLMDRFEALLVPSSNAGDLGLFIKEYGQEATPEEAQIMLEWLIIYQSDLILKINDLIYTEAYANPLYDVMGGMLDPSKVSDIEDPQVREDYQTLVDGYLTLVRYEETPVIETDWSALAALEGVFSQELAAFLTLKASSHAAYSEDYYAMAEKVIMVEDMIDATEDDFLKSQLQGLHRNLVYALLTGPEGMHMGAFVGKSDDLYLALTAFAADYPDTSFGQFLLELDDATWETYVGPQNAVESYLAFGYGSHYQWLREKEVTETVEGERVTLMSDTRPDIATKVNEGVDQAIETLAQVTEGTYAYTVYAYYSTEAYVSLYVSLHYLETPEKVTYLESALTFDLMTGDLLKLNDYLGLSEEAAIGFVNETNGTDYSLLPDFQMASTGLILSPQENETATRNWAMMSNKVLLPYVEFEALPR